MCDYVRECVRVCVCVCVCVREREREKEHVGASPSLPVMSHATDGVM